MTSISVVIPTHNASQTIGRTVDSVLNQTLLPDEIIFVDDCSTDSTVEVIHQHSGLSTCSNSRLLTTSTNSGPGVARNLGWNEAGSEFVAFLDADDSWHPQKLELQLAALLSHPWASFSGHRYLIDPGESMFVLRYSKLQYREFGLVHFLLRNRFSTPSVMISRNIKLRFGEHPGVSDDYLLWLRLLARGERALFLDAPLVHLHKAAYGEGGLSGQLVFMQRRELATYRALRTEKSISSLTLVGLQLFSLLKFLRRLMVVSTRKLRR